MENNYLSMEGSEWLCFLVQQLGYEPNKSKGEASKTPNISFMWSIEPQRQAQLVVNTLLFLSQFRAPIANINVLVID